MRRLTPLIGLMLLLAACGGSNVDEAPTRAAPAPDGTTTISSGADEVVDGPPAPDFELTLSDGSTFVLAAAEKPVYMVFWAEW